MCRLLGFLWEIWADPTFLVKEIEEKHRSVKIILWQMRLEHVQNFRVCSSISYNQWGHFGWGFCAEIIIL